MLLIPLALIGLVARRNYAAYGLTLKDWKYNVDVGLTCYPVRMISFGGYGLIALLRTSYLQPIGALILVITGLIEIGVILLIFRRHDQTGHVERASQASPLGNFIVLVALILFPIVLGFFLRKLTVDVVSTVFWQVVFSGFGEELFYRGYIQSRINQEFGRPWKVMGVSFGPGLIVAALIFGLSHAFNDYIPSMGRYNLSWWWAVWTVVGGLFFGLVREKAGSIIAPGLAHGVLDAVGEGAAVVFGWKL
jgi:membrane protease YdiL (CAAX protease family)